MVEEYLIRHPLLSALVWAALYASDYYLTLFGQKCCNAQDVIAYEGSYEMTPEYQDDIDCRHKVSWTLMFWLLFGVVLLYVTGLFAATSHILRNWYLILLGAFLIPEIGVHMRHIDGILLYRALASNDPGAEGRMIWRRSALYRRSGTEVLLLAAFTALLAALSSSWTLLGGAAALLSEGRKHLGYAKKTE